VRACDNPFRVQRLAQLAYRLQGTTWEALMARCAALGHRAALIGAEGHGKSTLLAELARRLAESGGFHLRAVTLRRGEVRLPPAERAALLAGAGERDLLLVDGAQELAATEWSRLRRAARSAGGLLITTHHAGLLPTLHECRTTPALLAGLVAELLAADAEGDDREELAPLPPAHELFYRHRGNLRGALLEAYDRCAES
jgi:energy-coupling factor transporter ATP-binding protein EcfA2